MGLPQIPLEDMDDVLRALLEPRVQRLGYLGEFFQLGAHQPRALAHFVAFTESLKDALPWRVVEVVALTVSGAASNEYERVQHERLALALGMSEAHVRAVLAGDVAPPAFSEAEVLAHHIALDFVEDAGRKSAPFVDRLGAIAGPDVAVGVVLTASRYVAHATAANAWGLRAPVESPLAAEVGR